MYWHYYRRRPSWRLMMTLGSIIFGVIGFGGVPDDLKTWSGWLGDFFKSIDGNAGRWILVVVAVLLILFANLVMPVVQRRKLKQLEPRNPQPERHKKSAQKNAVDTTISHPAIVTARKRLNDAANEPGLEAALAGFKMVVSRTYFKAFLLDHGVVELIPADQSAEVVYQLLGGKGEDEILSGLRGWIVVHEHDLSLDQLNPSFIGSLARGTPHSPPPEASASRP